MMNKADNSSMMPITIQQQHVLMLEAIKYIDMVCKKENIKYFAAFGTLLGAVREHGFIPYDDDADLIMKRDEYVRFGEAVKDYPDPRFFFQTVETDNQFFLPFLGRVRLNDTVRSSFEINAKYHNGIYVDIFPLDYGFASRATSRRRFKAASILHKLMYKRIRRLRNLRTLESMLLTAALKTMNMSFYDKIYRRIISNNNPDKTRLINFGGTSDFDHDEFPAEAFDETIELQFEDMMLSCPAQYDQLLRISYGDDYMTPLDRRYVSPLVKINSPLLPNFTGGNC